MEHKVLEVIITNPKMAESFRFLGSPTVLVNGVSYTGSFTDAAAFEAFVTAQVSKAAGSGK